MSTKPRSSPLDAETARATIAGLIDTDGTRHGSARGHRAMVAASPQSRRRCPCGCGTRATHTGLGDGLALTSGCELSVRRWVRDGVS